MTAGTGVLHSEFSSPNENTHLLQIWILPERSGLSPSYEKKRFPRESKRGRLRLIASRDGEDGSITIHQDIKVFASVLNSGEVLFHTIPDHRHCWIQIIEGKLDVNGVALSAGDQAAISNESEVRIVAEADETEFLLFDLK